MSIEYLKNEPIYEITLLEHYDFVYRRDVT